MLETFLPPKKIENRRTELPESHLAGLDVAALLNNSIEMLERYTETYISLYDDELKRLIEGEFLTPQEKEYLVSHSVAELFQAKYQNNFLNACAAVVHPKLRAEDLERWVLRMPNDSQSEVYLSNYFLSCIKIRERRIRERQRAHAGNIVREAEASFVPKNLGDKSSFESLEDLQKERTALEKLFLPGTREESDEDYDKVGRIQLSEYAEHRQAFLWKTVPEFMRALETTKESDFYTRIKVMLEVLDEYFSHEVTDGRERVRIQELEAEAIDQFDRIAYLILNNVPFPHYLKSRRESVMRLIQGVDQTAREQQEARVRAAEHYLDHCELVEHGLELWWLAKQRSNGRYQVLTESLATAHPEFNLLPARYFKELAEVDTMDDLRSLLKRNAARLPKLEEKVDERFPWPSDLETDEQRRALQSFKEKLEKAYVYASRMGVNRESLVINDTGLEEMLFRTLPKEQKMRQAQWQAAKNSYAQIRSERIAFAEKGVKEYEEMKQVHLGFERLIEHEGIVGLVNALYDRVKTMKYGSKLWHDAGERLWKAIMRAAKIAKEEERSLMRQEQERAVHALNADPVFAHFKQSNFFEEG